MYFDWGPDLLPTHMINEENCNWAYGFCVRSSQSHKYQTDFRAQNTKRLICLLASRLQHVFSLCTSKIYTLTWNWRTTILPVYRRREKRQCAPKVEVKMKPWCNFRIALLGISMGCYNISSDTHSTFMSLKMLSEVSLSCNKIHLLEHHLIEVWITGFLFVLSCKLGHSIEIHMSFSILTRQKMCKMHFGGDKISWITSFTRKINGINLLFGHLFMDTLWFHSVNDRWKLTRTTCEFQLNHSVSLLLLSSIFSSCLKSQTKNVSIIEWCVLALHQWYVGCTPIEFVCTSAKREKKGGRRSERSDWDPFFDVIYDVFI